MKMVPERQSRKERNKKDWLGGGVQALLSFVFSVYVTACVAVDKQL